MRRHIYLGFISIMIMLLISGCSLSTFKAKSGSGDPDASRALIKPEKNVAISSIDGKTVFVTARNWWVPVVTKTKASVIPGEHTLVIRYAQPGWSSLGCRVKIDAQPGMTYVVKGKRLPADGSEGFVAAKKPQVARIVVWIVDEETGATVVDETACQPVTS